MTPAESAADKKARGINGPQRTTKDFAAEKSLNVGSLVNAIKNYGGPEPTKYVDANLSNQLTGVRHYNLRDLERWYKQLPPGTIKGK